jgi:hypothetical protein
VREAGILIEKTGKDIVSIIADYLAKVWSYALEDITRARGRRFVSTHRFHVVVTVSAIWQDYAVQRMRRALQQAGILNKRPGCNDTTLAFVSEPEAAVLAAIKGHVKYDTLKPEQTFVIADLGGGTVVSNTSGPLLKSIILLYSVILESILNTDWHLQDLISFKVIATQPKLVLEEIVEGEGALCGATFLDQAFLTHLQKKLLKEKKARAGSLKSWVQMHELDRTRIRGMAWESEIK